MEFLDEYIPTNRDIPCYQCKNRKRYPEPPCQSTCEEYISWSRKREEAKREKEKDRLMYDYEHDRVTKNLRKSK